MIFGVLDSRIVEGSKEIWGASGVACELGVLGIQTPATVCTSSLPATPAPAQVWKGVFHGHCEHRAVGSCAHGLGTSGLISCTAHASGWYKKNGRGQATSFSAFYLAQLSPGSFLMAWEDPFLPSDSLPS